RSVFEGLVEGVFEGAAEGLELGLLLPVEALDLVEVEADEGVAVAEGVVDEGEGEVFAEGDEREGELGELDGRRVLVDAVEAALGDEAASVEAGVGVLFGQGGEEALAIPGGDDFFGQEAARGDEEGAGADGGVADLQAEDLLGRPVFAEAGEDGLEGALDDFLAEPARGVVAAGAAALFARLEDEAAGGDAVLLFVGFAAREVGEGDGGSFGVGSALEGGFDFGLGGGGQAAGVFEVALAVGRLHGAQGFRLDPDALGAEAHGRAVDAHDVVAHERLVDGADLLDVEGAVAQALALEDDEAGEDAVDGVVVDAGEVDGGALFGQGDGRGPPRTARACPSPAKSSKPATASGWSSRSTPASTPAIPELLAEPAGYPRFGL